MVERWKYGSMIGGGLLAVVVIACVLIWWGRSGRPVGQPAPLTEEQNVSLAEQGQRIVTAIYQYKEDVGLWPHSLDELVPEYLPEKPSALWYYNWFPYGYWSLTCFGGFPHTALRYSYGEGSGQWNVTTGDWDRPLKTNLKEPSPVPATPGSRDVKILNALRQRLGKKPGSADHPRALIVHLTRQGKYREARKVCEEYAQTFPEDWWFVLALAVIDSKDGRWAEGEKRLRGWAEEKREFGYYFLLSYFYETTGHKGRAREAIRTGSRVPMRDFPNHEGEMDWLAWEATDRVLREGDYKTVLALCDRWEEYRRGRSNYDPSYLTYRTASFLALGEFEKASDAMEKVEKAGLAIKWGRETGPLAAAIKRRDNTFRYEPNTKPDPFTWEIHYE